LVLFEWVEKETYCDAQEKHQREKNMVATSHALNPLAAAVLASAGLGLMAAAAASCSFLIVTAKEDEVLASLDDDASPSRSAAGTPPVLSTQIGIFCPANDYYDLSSDSMYIVSRVFMFVSLAVVFISTVVAWAIATFCLPTWTAWKMISALTALASVTQVPIFLLFETGPCSDYKGTQTCSMSTGSLLLVGSMVCSVAVTMVTQCLDPPLWVRALDEWRVEKTQIRTADSSLSSGGEPPSREGSMTGRVPVPVRQTASARRSHAKRRGSFLARLSREWSSDRVHRPESSKLTRSQRDAIFRDMEGGLNHTSDDVNCGEWTQFPERRVFEKSNPSASASVSQLPQQAMVSDKDARVDGPHRSSHDVVSNGRASLLNETASTIPGNVSIFSQPSQAVVPDSVEGVQTSHLGAEAASGVDSHYPEESQGMEDFVLGSLSQQHAHGTSQREVASLNVASAEESPTSRDRYADSDGVPAAVPPTAALRPTSDASAKEKEKKGKLNYKRRVIRLSKGYALMDDDDVESSFPISPPIEIVTVQMPGDDIDYALDDENETEGRNVHIHNEENEELFDLWNSLHYGEPVMPTPGDSSRHEEMKSTMSQDKVIEAIYTDALLLEHGIVIENVQAVHEADQQDFIIAEVQRRIPRGGKRRRRKRQKSSLSVNTSPSLLDITIEEETPADLEDSSDIEEVKSNGSYDPYGLHCTQSLPDLDSYGIISSGSSLPKKRLPPRYLCYGADGTPPRVVTPKETGRREPLFREERAKGGIHATPVSVVSEISDDSLDADKVRTARIHRLQQVNIDRARNIAVDRNNMYQDIENDMLDLELAEILRPDDEEYGPEEASL